MFRRFFATLSSLVLATTWADPAQAQAVDGFPARPVFMACPLFAALLLGWACVALAQSGSPVGVWRTYSDRTGEADGLVRIVEDRGEFVGRVVKVFSPPGESPNPLCERCPGELRNQPVVGIAILRGVRRGPDGYTEGTILDPDDGETYRCTLTLIDAGRRLEIHGFIGLPILGRTQVWTRVE